MFGDALFFVAAQLSGAKAKNYPRGMTSQGPAEVYRIQLDKYPGSRKVNFGENMNSIFYTSSDARCFAQMLAKPRFAKYLDWRQQSVPRALELYALNHNLARELHVCLHVFEITLRSKVDLKLQCQWGSDWILNATGQMMSYHTQEIDKATGKFKKIKKRDPNHDDLVASLTFGFWTAFSQQY